MTMESDYWSAVIAARIPAGELRALASLRTRADLRVIVRDDAIWIRWTGHSDEIVRCLLPVPGVALWVKRTDGQWSRFRSRLPTSNAPPDELGIPLIQALQPDRFESIVPRANLFKPLPIRLVRSTQPLIATAIMCDMKTLLAWSELATTYQLEQLRSTRFRNRVVIVGSSLPTIAGSIRFAGKRLLVPVGYRIEPIVSESPVLEALGANGGELAFVTDSAVDVIPSSAFAPLSRAGIRLAEVEP
jgi:hypothetical protein